MHADFGLPEPADDCTEVARERMRWDPHSCQGYVDANLPLLTADEQTPIYEEVIEAVRVCRRTDTIHVSVLMYGSTAPYKIHSIYIKTLSSSWYYA